MSLSTWLQTTRDQRFPENCLGLTLGRWYNNGLHLIFSWQVESLGSISSHLRNYLTFMSFHPQSGGGPSGCPIGLFHVSSCLEFQKPNQTNTEQGKAKLSLFWSKTTWRGNGILLGATVWVSKTLTMWFQNWVYVAWLHLAQQGSDRLLELCPGGFKIEYT